MLDKTFQSTEAITIYSSTITAISSFSIPKVNDILMTVTILLNLALVVGKIKWKFFSGD